MISYYFAIVFITVAAMATCIVQLFENETFSRRVKQNFVMIAILIIIGSLCEFSSFTQDEMYEGSRFIHGVVKAIEFSIAPIIPIWYVRVIDNRKRKILNKYANSLLVLINFIIETISVFHPFVFYIDENNVYRHGKFYFLYIAMYLTGALIFIVELLQYSKRYQSRNLRSLVAILLFLISGLTIHLYNSDVHTDWIVVSMIFIMFLVYYSDVILKVDALTELLNRKTYDNRLKKIDYHTVILLFDCNDFKLVNDGYGHQVGDKVLKVIAREIMNTYSKYAFCYRVGGDEFAVIFKLGVTRSIDSISQFVEKLNSELDDRLRKKNSDDCPLENGVSIGWTIFDGDDINIQDEHELFSAVKEAVQRADDNMYKSKNNK